MDINKIAFIICYNNEIYLAECLKYISFLNIPDGMTVDTITIKDAESMATGYNAAMLSSDAKYKVYLHQDVFILYNDFLNDIVDTFKKYPEYGLLGVLGGEDIPSNANFWCNWNKGWTYANNGVKQFNVKGSNEKDITNVSAIDGMIMITQYDIEWREDIFNGFDFYDASQSMEFIRRGYKVGIPNQKRVWCQHDCGHSNLQKYDYYRERFCDEYRDFGFVYSVVDGQEMSEKELEVLREKVNCLKNKLKKRDIYGLKEEINKIDLNLYESTELNILAIISKIIISENIENKQDEIFADCDLESTIDKYYRYRLFLMRLYYKKPMEDLLETCMDLAMRKGRGKSVVDILAECITFDEVEKVKLESDYFYLLS